MKISFTGTRKDMTEQQKETFELLIKKLNGKLLIHGDCIGADETAHNIAKKCGMDVHIRPGNIQKYRAKCDGIIIAKPKYPPDRNPDIVNDGDILIGASLTEHEQSRSGTWSTIRYAKYRKLPYIVIWPNGTYDVFNYEL